VLRPRNWLLALAVLFVAIQLVPYGRNHTNPPPGQQPSWDTPRTRELATRACFDCHSHETRWPWYSSIAPVSWRMQSHVDEGREHLNFSALELGREEPSEAAAELAKGAMPLEDYLLFHPEARLTAREKQDLVAGFEATFGTEAGGERGPGRLEDERERGESGGGEGPG
jgi:hypothetical protein